MSLQLMATTDPCGLRPGKRWLSAEGHGRWMWFRIKS